MIPLSHVDGVTVCEKLDQRVGNIERRRASKELDLAFSFESAEGRWAGWAQAITKLLKTKLANSLEPAKSEQAPQQIQADQTGLSGLQAQHSQTGSSGQRTASTCARERIVPNVARGSV